MYRHLTGLVPDAAKAMGQRHQKLLGGGAALSLNPLVIRRYEGILFHPSLLSGAHLSSKACTCITASQPVTDLKPSSCGVAVIARAPVIPDMLLRLCRCGLLPALDGTVLHCTCIQHTVGPVPSRYCTNRRQQLEVAPLDDVWGMNSKYV